MGRQKVGQPVRRESRIAFGLVWFDNEADALAYAEEVVKAGYTYNGGYLHGLPCGREPQFDYVRGEDGVKLFAVSN